MSRVDAPRPLRPPPLAASHHHGWLTPPRAAATGARDTTAPRAVSRRDPSVPPPWLAYRAATAWPNRCRWWARAAAGAGVRSRGTNRIIVAVEHGQLLPQPVFALTQRAG